MLFVYDKNNGVLEYLLSTGLDQLDIFKGYVKASISLATYLLVSSIMLNTALGLFTGSSLSLLAIVALITFAIGVSHHEAAVENAAVDRVQNDDALFAHA